MPGHGETGENAGPVLGLAQIGLCVLLFRDGLETEIDNVQPRQVGLIFAQVGLAEGVLEPDLFAALALVITETSLAGPLLLRRLWPQAAAPPGCRPPVTLPRPLRTTSAEGPRSRMERAEASDHEVGETMMSRIAVALLIGAVALAPVLSLAEEAAPLEQAVVEMADTPEEHAALAKHYRAKAEEARAEMRRHDQMGRVYVGGKSQHKKLMRTHCRNLSKRYSAIADEYDGLAKLHEDEAKQSE